MLTILLFCLQCYCRISGFSSEFYFRSVTIFLLSIVVFVLTYFSSFNNTNSFLCVFLVSYVLDFSVPSKFFLSYAGFLFWSLSLTHDELFLCSVAVFFAVSLILFCSCLFITGRCNSYLAIY